MLGRSLMLAGAAAVLFAAPSAAQEQTDYFTPESSEPLVEGPSSSPSDEAVEIVLTYTPGLEAALGIGLREYIDGEIDILHNALDRAGRDGGAVLVGLRRVDYTDANLTLDAECQDAGGQEVTNPDIDGCDNVFVDGAILDLGDGYSGPDGDLSWLSDWRDASEADLMGVMRVYATEQGTVCGAAPRPSGGDADEVAYYFMTTYQASSSGPCYGRSILAHEVGHNFDLGHQNTLYGANRGFQTGNGYRTIMWSTVGATGRLSYSSPSYFCPDGSSGEANRCGRSMPPQPANAAGYLVSDPYEVVLHRNRTAAQQLYSAVLPTGRAIATSGSSAVTFSATISNPHSTIAYNCRVELPGAGTSNFSFQTMTSGGVLTGTVNDSFDIPVNDVRYLNLSYTPTSTTLIGQALVFEYYCDERRSAAYTHGVAISYLTTNPTSAPSPDLIANLIAVTATSDGAGSLRVQTNGVGVGVGSVSNIGANGAVVAQAMTPQQFLAFTTASDNQIDAASAIPGATLQICRTDLSSCSYSSSVTMNTSSFSLDGYGNQYATYNVRVLASGVNIAYDPSVNRIFVVFTESGTNRLLGATSIAVCSQGATGGLPCNS